MIEAFVALLLTLFLWGPSMGQVPNSGCYISDKNFEQRRPCRPEETR